MALNQSDYIALGLALGVGLFVWSKREPTDRTGMTRPPENGNGRGNGAAVDPRIAEAIKFISDLENNPLVDPATAAITLDTAATKLAEQGAPAEAVQLLRDAAQRMRDKAAGKGGGGGEKPPPQPPPPADLTTRYNDLIAKGSAYLNDTGPMDETTINAMATTVGELITAGKLDEARTLTYIAGQVRIKKGAPSVANNERAREAGRAPR